MTGLFLLNSAGLVSGLTKHCQQNKDAVTGRPVHDPGFAKNGCGINVVEAQAFFDKAALLSMKTTQLRHIIAETLGPLRKRLAQLSFAPDLEEVIERLDHGNVALDVAGKACVAAMDKGFQWASQALNGLRPQRSGNCDLNLRKIMDLDIKSTDQLEESTFEAFGKFELPPLSTPPLVPAIPKTLIFSSPGPLDL